MNLETRLNPNLWEAIQDKYERRDYTAAIIDAFFFLSNLIREKTGLESDGVSLAGQAFGGKDPRLKVNKLQTESEINIQQGLEQILRGLYRCVRNPRSHEKYSDALQDAEHIILFINYLITLIDKSQARFTKTSFLARVFDPDFAARPRYAELIVKDIPTKYRFDVFCEVYKQKLDGDGNKLRFFFTELFKVLTEEERKDAYRIISEELKRTDNNDVVRATLHILPSYCWENLEEVTRLRIENKLIKEIEAGKYIPDSRKFLGGWLGTWIIYIPITSLLLLKELVFAIASKLETQDVNEQEYAFNFFISYIFPNIDPQNEFYLKHVMKAGLESGNKRYQSVVMRHPKWHIALKEAMEKFIESKPTVNMDDDIPF